MTAVGCLNIFSGSCYLSSSLHFFALPPLFPNTAPRKSVVTRALEMRVFDEESGFADFENEDPDVADLVEVNEDKAESEEAAQEAEETESEGGDLQQALAASLTEAEEAREALSLVDNALQLYGLARVEIRGDGNCLFTVLAMALTEQGFEPGSLREKLVGEVKRNPERYASLPDLDGELQDGKKRLLQGLDLPSCSNPLLQRPHSRFGVAGRWCLWRDSR